MEIAILEPWENERMRRAGRVAAATLDKVARRVRAGMSTGAIDRLVRADTAARGGTPAQLGYEGFPAAVCTSRNAVVCHGIPSRRERIGRGDIINLDVTTCLDGYHGDTSRTLCIGPVSADARHVVDTAQRCLEAGIAAVRPGVRLGAVGAAVEAVARAAGCSVVRELGGHGIGQRMHQPPHVHHVGPADAGPVLVPGMAFTVEPMISLGGPAVRCLSDGWTIVTEDGSLSAQFEHTVLVAPEGCEVLTAWP
jgi:methionyl aminopeptidase